MSAGTNGNVSLDPPCDIKRQRKDTTLSNLGPVKDSERQDLNCAVKEYLLLAGYRLTAMTFYEEVKQILIFYICLILVSLRHRMLLSCSGLQILVLGTCA